jgi:AcrR family transcriptional regulator
VRAVSVESPSSPTPLRVDARRNRDQIVAAAKSVFAEKGSEVPMDEIARTAGVGVGTLYRRFPDREALIVAVVRDSLDTLLLQIRSAAGEEARAWDALVNTMSYSRELRLVLPQISVSATMKGAIRGDPVLRRLRHEVYDEVSVLVSAAQREGTLRADVGPADLLVLFTLVYKITVAGPDLAEQVSARALGVILDGLAAGAGTPLPGHALTDQDFRDHWAPQGAEGDG